MDNVVSNPDEEKYRKVRASNKAFQEKVCAVTGSVLFLEAVGFEQRNLSQGKCVMIFFQFPLMCCHHTVPVKINLTFLLQHHSSTE